MIVVDTSALIAVVLKEPDEPRCKVALMEADHLLISAATFAGALIVAARRGVAEDLDRLVADLSFEVMPVTPSVARRVAAAYGSWGKGIHPASLNYGDCFAYALAKEHDCPLLYVGNDFARTDIIAA